MPKSKISKINRYKEPLIITKGKKKEAIPYYYCKVGDSLSMITKNASPEMVAVIVENKNGERFSILYSDLQFTEFNLEDDL